MLQLVAGEQIDHLFGARMGLTVLASAGLGNMVADVVGVSATHSVQENMKRFYKPPRLRWASSQTCVAVRWHLLALRRGCRRRCCCSNHLD